MRSIKRVCGVWFFKAGGHWVPARGIWEAIRGR